MKRPLSLKTRIFLDSADPKETEEAISILGFLDGQTTNPTLLLKHEEARDNALNFYRDSVRKISNMVTGSVSIEINADKDINYEKMFKQARAMDAWLSEGRARHIKFPITHEGLKAARLALNDGICVNMTLGFSQEQAAAVYAATRGACKGQVFISLFVGRLDDAGYNGMDLVKNVIHMYENGDGHVEVLTASIRNLDHLFYAIAFGSDVLTAPLVVLKDWAKTGMYMRDYDEFQRGFLKPIEYKNISLSGCWRDFDIYHPLTSIGLQKFADDWNKLMK